MISPPTKTATTTELLLMPNGQVLAHNLTPTMAALLAELNPLDEPMRHRAGASVAREKATQLRNDRDEAIG